MELSPAAKNELSLKALSASKRISTTMTGSERIIEDTAEICLEILDGKALCRECTIDPEGSAPELDYRAFCSTDPAEFSAHILKHISLRPNVDIRLADIALWEEALQVYPRGVRIAHSSPTATLPKSSSEGLEQQPQHQPEKDRP